MRQLQTHLPPFCVWKSLSHVLLERIHYLLQMTQRPCTTVRIHRRSLNHRCCLGSKTADCLNFTGNSVVHCMSLSLILSQLLTQSTEMRSGKHYVPEEYQIFFYS